MKEAKRSLIEVIIGIWFLAVVVILAGVFFRSIKNSLCTGRSNRQSGCYFDDGPSISLSGS